MGQKTNPICNRLGIIKGWEANWFATKKNFPEMLHQDNQIRDYLNKAVPGIIAKIFIERVSEIITITIHTSKPGVLIGPGGQKVQELKEGIQKRISKNVRLKISEVKMPELNARLVAENIAKQIQSRTPYKRAGSRAVDNAIHLGAKGIQIELAGRLGGAEKSRRAKFTKGSIPRQTFRADVDYAQSVAHTTYGTIGVKVWIFTRQVYGKRDLSLNVETFQKKRKGR